MLKHGVSTTTKTVKKTHCPPIVQLLFVEALIVHDTLIITCYFEIIRAANTRTWAIQYYVFTAGTRAFGRTGTRFAPKGRRASKKPDYLLADLLSVVDNCMRIVYICLLVNIRGLPPGPDLGLWETVSRTVRAAILQV